MELPNEVVYQVSQARPAPGAFPNPTMFGLASLAAEGVAWLTKE